MSDVTQSPPQADARVAFLGLPFANLDMAQAIAAVQRASEATNWHYVVTPNAAHLSRLSKSDSALRQIYENAHLCFLDSRVIWLLARLIGLRPPQVIPGSDLVAQLFQHAITPLSPICVVGGGSNVAGRLKERFAVGTIYHTNPAMGFWQNEEEFEKAAAFVVACGARYTFLAVGSPQQEKLAAQVAAMGRARGVGICVGASIDFVTGSQQRAPAFLQRLALEWAYRFFMEPRRLAYRYLVESPKGVLFLLRNINRR